MDAKERFSGFVWLAMLGTVLVLIGSNLHVVNADPPGCDGCCYDPSQPQCQTPTPPPPPSPTPPSCGTDCVPPPSGCQDQPGGTMCPPTPCEDTNSCLGGGEDPVPSGYCPTMPDGECDDPTSYHPLPSGECPFQAYPQLRALCDNGTW